MVKKSDSFSFDQLKKLMDLPKPIEEQMLFKMLYYTAGRISEVVGRNGIRPIDINYDKKIILMNNLKAKKFKYVCSICQRVLKAVDKKCSDPRCDPLIKPQKIVLQKNVRRKEPNVPPEFLEELKAFVQYQKKLQEELNKKGKKKLYGDDLPIFPFSRWTAQRIVRRNCKEVGIERMGDRFPHPHTFRHTAATLGLEEGQTLSALQDQLGHSSLVTLSQYLSISDKVREEFIAKKRRI
jgi:integrase